MLYIIDQSNGAGISAGIHKNQEFWKEDVVKDHEEDQLICMTPCTDKRNCRFIQAYGKFSLELYEL